MAIEYQNLPVYQQKERILEALKENQVIVVQSPTGSGKTISCILPLIFNLACAGESMVINDTKGELYSYTAEFLKE